LREAGRAGVAAKSHPIQSGTGVPHSKTLARFPDTPNGNAGGGWAAGTAGRGERMGAVVVVVVVVGLVFMVVCVVWCLLSGCVVWKVGAGEFTIYDL